MDITPTVKVRVLGRPTARRDAVCRLVQSLGADLDLTLEGNAPQLTIACHDGDAEEHTLERLSALSAQAPLLVLSQRPSQLNLAELFRSRVLTHLIGSDVERVTDELEATIRKIVGRDVFGLDKYFPCSTGSQCKTLVSSAERGPAVEWIQQYALGLGAPNRLAATFAGVAEELISNALFDAPGIPLTRGMHMVLPKGREVQVRVCTDGVRLGMSVLDAFGTLTLENAMNALARCFQRDNDQVCEGPGGAGLGLYLAFQGLTQLVLNVEQGLRTESIGVVSLTRSYREHAHAGKSFHFFNAV